MALFFDNRGVGELTLRSPASGTYTLTFPPTAGTAGYYLQTDGSGNLLWAPGIVAMNDGTTTCPGFAFGADVDTGFYRPGNNILAISSRGMEIVRFSSSGIDVSTGNITLQSKPTDSLHAASKSYVDDAGSIVVVEPTTTRILTPADAGRYIRTTNINDITITVAPQSVVEWEDNTEIRIEQSGTGQVIIEPGSGVNVNVASGYNRKSEKQYTTLVLKRTGIDTWSLFGALELAVPLSASKVAFTSTKTINATNVEQAIQELDDNKLNSSTASMIYLTQINAASSYAEINRNIASLVETNKQLAARIEQLEQKSNE